MRTSSDTRRPRLVSPASKRASVLPVLLSGIVLIGAGTMVAALGFPQPGPSPQPQPDPDLVPLATPELRVLLHRAGLDPDTLICVGTSYEQLGLLSQSALAHLAQNLTAIRAADRGLAAARTRHDDLYRKVQNRTATEQERAGFPSAQTALATAKSEQFTAIRALQSAAVTGVLTPEQIQLLQTASSNKAWDTPPQYRLVDRTEPEWVNLKRALSAIAIAQRQGQTPPASAWQIVSAADTDPRVANAAAWLRDFSVPFHDAFNQGTTIRP